ncbi:MAG: 2-amino-4-hydroxy-6-hydroxymethyldihydropteridine diphosphokinase [Pseudonocardiaceae bacterium]|nr:2-amino-4-hydroxy-6-hydroxymethyldihydropteridine diphosphokinase [Pseudonocardiaceae bacterium]
MSTAVLSVGSNVGDRLAHLQECVRGLGPAVRAVSPVYSTVPWGGVEQDDFLNAVLLVDDPTADAHEWLRRAQQQEREAQRTRGIRWGPRTLDVDIIDVAGLHGDSDDLTLPHPRAHQRAFVLVPWHDVAPDAVLPGHGAVADLVAGLPATERDGVRRRDDLSLGTP